MAQAGDRSEKPTHQRLLKASRKGQFASSKDLVSGPQFIAFVILLPQFGPKLLTSFKEVMRATLSQAFRSDLEPSTLLEIVHQSFARSMYPLIAASSGLVVSALAFQFASTRFSLSLQRMVPKASNFSVLSKLKQAPQRGIVSAIQATALLAVFGSILYWIAANNASKLLLIAFRRLDAGLQIMRVICMDVLWKASAFFLLFGMIDLFRQKRKFDKQMKMSKQEVRDDAKESEGNPQTKMRIRRLQRDVRRRRMMDEVKTATALIVNPTHYAVACRYSHDSMAAPVVVAKGTNYLAMRIRARALEHDVPLVENPPLAQALYKSVEVGQQIPPHLFRAVAEILAYIYKLMGARLS